MKITYLREQGLYFQGSLKIGLMQEYFTLYVLYFLTSQLLTLCIVPKPTYEQQLIISTTVLDYIHMTYHLRELTKHNFRTAQIKALLRK